MMILIGIPLFYLEAALGQFCSRGPTTCWEFAPLFKGRKFAKYKLRQQIKDQTVLFRYDLCGDF